MVEPYHKTKWEDNDQVGGFEGRMERIIKGLRVKSLCYQFWNTLLTDIDQESKAVCKQVLDPLYRHRLVDAPLAEFAVSRVSN